MSSLIITTSTAVIGLILACITLITTVLALLWRAFRIHADVQAVVAEMRPNHGSSLRDQLDAVRGFAESNAQALADSDARMVEMGRSNIDAHTAIHRRIDALFALLASPDRLHHLQPEED